MNINCEWTFCAIFYSQENVERRKDNNNKCISFNQVLLAIHWNVLLVNIIFLKEWILKYSFINIFQFQDFIFSSSVLLRHFNLDYSMTSKASLSSQFLNNVDLRMKMIALFGSLFAFLLCYNISERATSSGEMRWNRLKRENKVYKFFQFLTFDLVYQLNYGQSCA